MNSSVKAIFLPSTKKKHAKTTSSGTPPVANAQSLSYLRPSTPVSSLSVEALLWCNLVYFRRVYAEECFVILKESVRKQLPSSPSEPFRVLHSQRSSSPISSPLQDRRTDSGDAGSFALEDGVQLSQSVPDLRQGIRHVRSTSQPTKPVTTPHRESFSSVTFPDRSNSVNSETSYYTEAAEVPMIVQEDIIALTCHVRTFSEALGSLRNTFIECEGMPTNFCLQRPQLLCKCIKLTFFYSPLFNLCQNKLYEIMVSPDLRNSFFFFFFHLVSSSWNLHRALLEPIWDN